MKETVKKQEKCIINAEELRAKVLSLFAVMGPHWVKAGKVKTLLKEKNVPYKASVMHVLVNLGFVMVQGESVSMQYRVITSEMGNFTQGVSVTVLAELRKASAKYCTKYQEKLRAAKNKSKQNLNELAEKHVKDSSKSVSLPQNGEAIRFPREDSAVEYLKSRGYKIFKPITAYKEV